MSPLGHERSVEDHQRPRAGSVGDVSDERHRGQRLGDDPERARRGDCCGQAREVGVKAVEIKNQHGGGDARRPQRRLQRGKVGVVRCPSIGGPQGEGRDEENQQGGEGQRSALHPKSLAERGAEDKRVPGFPTAKMFTLRPCARHAISRVPPSCGFGHCRIWTFAIERPGTYNEANPRRSPCFHSVVSPFCSPRSP